MTIFGWALVSAVNKESSLHLRAHMSSKYCIRNVLSAACLTFGLAVASAHAAEISTHKHEHGTASVELSLNNGKKWVTDEALRKRFVEEAIRKALNDCFVITILPSESVKSSSSKCAKSPPN